MANSQTQGKILCALVGQHSYIREGDLMVCRVCGESKPYERKSNRFAWGGVSITASHYDLDNKEVHDRYMGNIGDEEEPEDDE